MVLNLPNDDKSRETAWDSYILKKCKETTVLRSKPPNEVPLALVFIS